MTLRHSSNYGVVKEIIMVIFHICVVGIRGGDSNEYIQYIYVC